MSGKQASVQVFGPDRLRSARVAYARMIEAERRYMSAGGGLAGDYGDALRAALIAARADRNMYSEYGDSVLA